MSDTTKKEVVNDLYNAHRITHCRCRRRLVRCENYRREKFGGTYDVRRCDEIKSRCRGKFIYRHVSEREREEVKRHNHALEELAEAKEKFYESEVKRRNQELRRRQEILDANHDIEETNKALDELRNYNRRMDLSAPDRKPKLSDYYRLSDNMQKYMYVTVSVVGLRSGYALTRIL
ncbi:Hypothetical predicted protein [Paramuricea clavata]|uniref:Uncharacterized protein n=1 Tax=Paramuricea clavata TaxID=317549 RepID=A0A7D9HT87_PARCT|nr:Hypothetical predicted protein [Paramuricea clavata]